MAARFSVPAPMLAALVVLGIVWFPPTADAKQPPRDFFGVAPQASIGPADIARMGAGGVGTLRLNFSWPQVDPAGPAGDLDWRVFDGVVAEAARHRIRIFPVLYGTPTWVAGLDGRKCYPHCQPFLPQSRPALNAFAEFAADAAARYGKRGEFWAAHPELPPTPIRAWQIWNEQNSGQYTRPQPSIGAYSRLLATASRAIRSRDPRADVVVGGMFADPVTDEVPGVSATGYLRRLYKRRGIERHFNGIAVHPYSARFANVRGQVADLRRIARRAGDPNVSTWVTEIGWASGGVAHPLNKGPRGQARFLRRSYRLFITKRRAWRVRLVAWFSWRDSTGEPICKWCPESGLFEAAYGLQPKPAWDVYTGFSGGS